MDVVLRTAIATIMYARSSKWNTRLLAILAGPPRPPLLIEFRLARDIQRISEEALARQLKEAMEGRDDKCVKVLGRKDLRDILPELMTVGYKVYYLHEKGKLINCSLIRPYPKLCFILGDQKGLAPEDERYLDNLGIERISLGPTPYLASFCIVATSIIIELCYGPGGI